MTEGVGIVFSQTRTKLNRITSLLTLAFFLSTQVVSANPGVGIEIAPPREAPGFFQIDIPDELATLDGLYEAPSHADPKFILHVQNAHANYGAQQKIKQLLQYLEKTYAIKTIFVEGASEDLNPDYLKLFPDKERNLKLAQFLAEQGELTGAELYLLDQSQDDGGRMTDEAKDKATSAILHPASSPVVQAHGIEDAALYRENYEALKKVFSSEAIVKKYLEGFEGRLSSLASKVFPADLLKLLGEWKKFEKGHREFMPYIRNLSGEAKRVLGLDLESLLAQVEWPQITRLLVLQELEKELDAKEGLVEREALLRFLREKKVSGELIAAIENFQDQRLSVLRGDADVVAGPVRPRDLMEQLVIEAGPKGFRFSDYPHFSLYAGYLILKNELDPKGLFSEIKVLFLRILDKLAETPHQKALLALYREEELVRKLLNLELTRKDWQEVLAREDLMSIDSMVARLKDTGTAVNNEKNLPQSDFEKRSVNGDFRKQVLEVQDAAYKFYEAALKREDVFFEKISAVMREKSLSKAVLITGGFHTEGITELLREHEVSYGILTPRLSENSDENLYRSVMLQNRPSTFELSYLEAASRLMKPDAMAVQVGEDQLLESLKPLLMAINYADGSVDIANAIKIFNAQNTGLVIDPTPVRTESGKSVYHVSRSEMREPIPSAVSAPRSELEGDEQQAPPSAESRKPAATFNDFLRSQVPRLYLFSMLAGDLLLGALYATLIDWGRSDPLAAAANVFLVTFLNYNLVDSFFTRLLTHWKTSVLPEIPLEESLPDQYRTVAYYPVLFRSEAELEFFEKSLIPSIENNNDPNIKWVVMSTSPGHIQASERAKIQDLQKRYGRDRIFYFHRDRAVNNWEKKRGGYMHFMVWLKNSLRPDGTIEPDPRFPTMPSGPVFDEILGDIRSLAGVKDFTVGDSDTVWPLGTVKKIVSKIHHPDNSGYVIFQGRLAPSNEDDSLLTKFTAHFYRKFHERGDSQWKVFRRGIYLGHGAGWEVDKFLTAVAGNIREGFLSHDIIESVFAKTAFVSDVTTLEDVPQNFFLAQAQWRRWWEGNKASFVFLGREAPDEKGDLRENPADYIYRYMLFSTSKNFLSTGAFVLFLTLNFACSPFIFFHSLGVAGFIYLLFIGFELFGTNFMGDKGPDGRTLSFKGTLFFTLMSLPSIVLTGGFVMGSYVRGIVDYGRKKTSSWTPQGSLPKTLTLSESFSRLQILSGGAFLGMLLFHGYWGWIDMYVLSVLAAAPFTAYVGSLKPGAKTTRSELIPVKSEMGAPVESSMRLRSEIRGSGTAAEAEKEKQRTSSWKTNETLKLLSVLLSLISLPVIAYGALFWFADGSFFGMGSPPAIVEKREFTEEDYLQLYRMRDQYAMESFVRNVARSIGREVVSEPDLQGFAAYYSGELTKGSKPQSLKRMKEELAVAPWTVPASVPRSEARAVIQDPQVVSLRDFPSLDHYSYLNRNLEPWYWLRENLLEKIFARATRKSSSEFPEVRVLVLGSSTGEEMARSFYEVVTALESKGRHVSRSPSDPGWNPLSRMKRTRPIA